MKNDMFLQCLGLARRAGKLCCGFDSVAEQKHCLNVVFVSQELSARTEKNLIFEIGDKSIKIVHLKYGMSELGYAMGTKPVGIIGVSDKGFAELLIGKLHREVIQ